MSTADQLEDLRRRFEVDRVAIALIERGEVEVVSAGATEKETFEAASLSKLVFTELVLDAVADDLMQLDAPLAEWCSLEEARLDPRLGSITVEMVLSHCSGLPNNRRAHEPIELLTDPGTTFRYSGEGFMWMQQVLERAIGLDLETLAQAKIFGPLALRSSSFGEYPSARGSLRTTATDFARFCTYVLERSAAGLRPSLLEPVTPIDRELAWGLGWGIEQTATACGWQWGQAEGVANFAIVRPSGAQGVVALSRGGDGRGLYREVVLAALGTDHPSLCVEENDAWIAAANM